MLVKKIRGQQLCTRPREQPAQLEKGRWMVQGAISKENVDELQKGEPHFQPRKEGLVSDRHAENTAEKK